MKEMKQKAQNPESCDCCKDVEALTPVVIDNRPGLDAISYRVGTHGSFLETMKARLSSSNFPKLAGLTTRDSTDATIALLDAWSTVADILTFYQERIATEGYLRTATERRSILELARLVGYRLRPGLSASVYLAYTLDQTQETTIIEPGNKAQSLPGPNETPQVFETADRLIAHSGLNVMKPRLTQQQFITELNSPTIVLQGSSNNIRVNDGLLLDVAVKDTPVQGAFYRVIDVTPDAKLGRTTVNLASPKTSSPSTLKLDIAGDFVAAVAEIAGRYQNLNTFGLSEKSKIVKSVRDVLVKLSEPVDPNDKNNRARDDLAVLETFVPQLTDQYAFSSSRGYDKIALWLGGLKGALEQFLLVQDQLEAVSKIFDTTGAGEGEKQDELQTLIQYLSDAIAFFSSGGYDDIASRLTVLKDYLDLLLTSIFGVQPSFVELFQPFTQPQSVQPIDQEQLARPLDRIYSKRSEFISQLYSVLQPQAAPFVKAILANASPVQESKDTEGSSELTKVQALRLKASLAGHNLPIIITQTTGAASDTSTIVSPPILRQYIDALRTAGFAAEPGKDLMSIALDNRYDQIKGGSQIAIERPVLDAAGAPTNFEVSVHSVDKVQISQLTFNGVSFTCTVLTLKSAWLPAEESQSAALQGNALIRSTTVFAQSELLTQAETEITDEISFTHDDPAPVIELDAFYSSLEPGRWTIISGERLVTDVNGAKINTGVQVSELVMVASVSHEAKTLLNHKPVQVKGDKLHTFIRPATAPAYSYKRDTVKIYGNVVRATHGERRNEVLGSADGSKTLQSFALRQPPLTYLAAPTPSGADSTLEVRVNDIKWHDAPNLFELHPFDRSYITKIADDGKTTVIFGDGEHGARPPTGVENVKAVYRSGIGSPGNVRAEQIKLPLTKPLGVKGVINPIPASGGADKETRDQARRNAPIGVFALDRLVSVQDYAYFARTFAGIAKANSQRLSDGVRQVVHLTISGVGDAPIDLTSDLYRNLLAALGRFGDPLQPVQVETSERVLLVIRAKVKLLPDYLWESVSAKIRAVLLNTFGFENRDIGQDVTQSEVLSAIQSVPGVDYVDLDLLDSVTEAKLTDTDFAANLELKPRVNASLATINDTKDDILPGQLVFLSPAAGDTLIIEEVL